MNAEEEYKKFLERFAKTHGITEIQAETHLIVQEYRKFVFERAQENDRERQATNS